MFGPDGRPRWFRGSFPPAVPVAGTYAHGTGVARVGDWFNPFGRLRGGAGRRRRPPLESPRPNRRARFGQRRAQGLPARVPVAGERRLRPVRSGTARAHATTGQRPIDLLAREGLTPLATVPAYRFLDPVRRTVSFESMVHFRGSRYSVPPPFAGRPVEVAAAGGRIVVRAGDTVIGERLAVGGGSLAGVEVVCIRGIPEGPRSDDDCVTSGGLLPSVVPPPPRLCD